MTTKFENRINCSSTAPPVVRRTFVNMDLDKRQGWNFGLLGGKTLTIFMDVVSMPEVQHGSDDPQASIRDQNISSDVYLILAVERAWYGTEE